jgi:hypothetical protein
MIAAFGYNKPQVIQALRYHFISRKELRLMIILVNVFALLSLVLYLMGKITPLAFITNALLWIALMVSIWFIMPVVVYNRTEMFRKKHTMYFNENDFTLEYNGGKRSWQYKDLSDYKESPYFFHLYFNPRTFLLVPKDGFKNAEDIATLRRILMNIMGSK